MGGAISACSTASSDGEKLLRAKVLALEEEIEELKRGREQRDAQLAASSGKRVAVVASEEEQRKPEMEMELTMAESESLTVEVEEEEEEEEEEKRQLRSLTAAVTRGRDDWNNEPWGGWCRSWSTGILEGEVQRDEPAGEKWKQLYLAIKTELDDLIRRTHQGGRCDWRAEELMMEWHEKEVKAQEEMMKMLRSRIATMEKEEAKRDTEIDILRQSLRILGATKRRNNFLRAFCVLTN